MYIAGAGCAIALLPDFNSSVIIMGLVNTTKQGCELYVFQNRKFTNTSSIRLLKLSVGKGFSILLIKPVFLKSWRYVLFT